MLVDLNLKCAVYSPCLVPSAQKLNTVDPIRETRYDCFVSLDVTYRSQVQEVPC